MGINSPNSILNIKSKLIINNIVKAIGETIFITLVKEAPNIVVNINPNNSIKRITPKTTINPKLNNFLLGISSSTETLFAK